MYFLQLTRNEVIKFLSNLSFQNYKKVVMSESFLLARVHRYLVILRSGAFIAVGPFYCVLGGVMIYLMGGQLISHLIDCKFFDLAYLNSG